jgi:SARP family transcriptional regulator, regulator of embCAB operon
MSDLLVFVVFYRQVGGASPLGPRAVVDAHSVDAGRRLIRLAPLRESGYQVLMQALASQGNSAEALRVYTNLCAVLRDELGVSPCATTQAVYGQLVRD